VANGVAMVTKISRASAKAKPNHSDAVPIEITTYCECVRKLAHVRKNFLFVYKCSGTSGIKSD